MAEIRAVFFDLGRVLLDFDLGICFSRIYAETGIAEDTFRKAVLAETMPAFEKGRITSDEFFGRVKLDTGYPGSVESLLTYFNEIFTPMHANISIAQQIGLKLPIGIISNTNAAHTDFVEREYGFLSQFFPRIYSQNVGSRKPEPEIFLHAVSALNIKPEEALFIDDLTANLEGAMALGFKTVHLPLEADLGSSLRAFPELGAILSNQSTN